VIPIRLHAQADRELTESAAFYEREREGLGEEFLSEIARSLEFISQFPVAAPVVRGSIRSLVVSRFPYSIVYRKLETGTLRVLAIAHHKRRPEYWRSRR
jgi:toxin ParE1/3/4